MLAPLNFYFPKLGFTSFLSVYCNASSAKKPCHVSVQHDPAHTNKHQTGKWNPQKMRINTQKASVLIKSCF